MQKKLLVGFLYHFLLILKNISDWNVKKSTNKE